LAEQLFDAIAARQGDHGAKCVIARHLEAMTPVPLVEAAFDIDPPKDL
jgi:CTP:molybdopterin cytidylyltransferase MocA